MSQLAEFASNLHNSKLQKYPRNLEPIKYPSRVEKLHDIRAIIFDVYGTLINYWRPGIADTGKRPQVFQECFSKISEMFGLTNYLFEMDPGAVPEKTLSDLYHGLITVQHNKALKKGATFPEVKIEEIWALILLMVKRRGYDHLAYGNCPLDEFSRRMAFSYNFFSLGRELYPNVVSILETLKKSNMSLGIVSNAQFYTPIDLSLLFRDQSEGRIDDFNEMFDPDLTFFSFEYGVAKPNQLLFRKLYDALYEYQILPEQTVFVGNDLSLDIEPAALAGMHTALFTGDKETLYYHGKENTIIPDIVFESWEELPHKLSFFAEGSAS